MEALSDVTTQYDVTDTAAGAGATSSCAGIRVHASAQDNTATSGGGGSTTTFLIHSKLENKALIMYEITPANSLKWNAGTYTVNAHFSGTSFTWVSTWVCWMDSSSNELATIGSNINHNTAIFQNQHYEITVSGVEVPNKANGDKIYVVLRLKNTSAISNTLTYTNDGHVITPLDTIPTATVHIKGATLKGCSIL